MWFVHIHSQMTTTKKTKKTTSKSFFLKDLPCSSWLYIRYNITDYHINNYQINFIKLHKKKLVPSSCLPTVCWRQAEKLVHCADGKLYWALSHRRPRGGFVVKPVRAVKPIQHSACGCSQSSHCSLRKEPCKYQCVCERAREREADRQPDRQRQRE